MPAVLVQTGMTNQLTDIKAFQADWRLVLFQNNYNPVPGSVLANLTLATFSGYAPGNVVNGAVAINGGGIAQMSAGTVTFTHNGGGVANTIYGYAVIDNANNVLIWAERFAAQRSMGANGDSISITLTFTLGP